MLKQLILLAILSFLLIIGMSYAHQALEGLLYLHNAMDKAMMNVFSGGQAGNIARQFIVILAIPVIVGLVPAILFWFVKRRWFPYFMELVWVTWFLQMGALAMATKI